MVIGGQAKVGGAPFRIFTHAAMYQHPIVRSLIVLTTLAGVALVVFLPTLHWPLLSDDYDMVWGTGKGWGTWRHGFFRPVSFLSFRIIHVLAGDGAIAHRAFNLFVHTWNAFLVFFLTRSFFQDRPNAGTAAWTAALLFVVYPFHQEAIVWCVGRYPSMATLFMLVALVAVGSGTRWLVRFALVQTCYVVAVLTYEIAFCLPVLVLLMLRSRNEALRTWVIGFAMVTGALLAGRWMIAGNLSSGYLQTLFQHEALTYALAAPKTLFRLFLPPCENARSQFLRALLLFVGLGLLGWRSKGWFQRPSTRQVIVLVLTMLIFSSWLAFVGGVSTRTSESDRFLYLPSVFLCIVIGILLAQISDRRWRWSVAGSLLVIFLFALRANHRNWAIASEISTRTIDGIEREGTSGPLVVNDLPDEYEGAFIFRHGVRSALLLRGVDTARVRIGALMTRDEMLTSGVKDMIEQRFDHEAAIGYLMRVSGPCAVGRSCFEWTP